MKKIFRYMMLRLKNTEIMKKKTTACRMIWDGNGYIDSIYYSNSVVNAGFGKKNDVIYCNHVFEHANNPLEFLEKVKLLLKDDRIYIFIYIVSVWYG